MTTEPCGSLPTTGINVSAHYCVAHDAWSSHVQTWRHRAGDEVEVTHSQSMRFGPFDDEIEVRGWLLRALLAMDDLLP
jgi:hypothetical protein